MVSVIQTLAVLVSYMFFRFRFIQSRRFYIGVIQTFVIEILLTPFRFRPWPSLADGGCCHLLVDIQLDIGFIV